MLPRYAKQNTIKKRTIGLIVFVVLIALIVGIFAAIAALQWWVAKISALAVPVVIAVWHGRGHCRVSKFQHANSGLENSTSHSPRRDQKTRRDNPPPSTATAKNTTVSRG
jgi:hypothetical protein